MSHEDPSVRSPSPAWLQRPLLAVAVVSAAGIATGGAVEVSLSGLMGAALLLATLCVGWGRLRPLLLWVVVFFAGWVNLSWRTAVLSDRDLRALVGERPALVTLRGKLCRTPSQRLFEREETEEVWRTLAPVEVHALRVGRGPWEPARGLVQTSTRGAVPAAFFAGQPVEVSGVLTPPPGPVADGLFNYRAYLDHLGIHYLLKVGSAQDWRPAGPVNAPPWTERFRSWAQATLARGLPEIDEATRLQWAMLLGWKTALTDEVAEPFMRSGTMHIFAISGLHIALIAGILVAVLRLVLVPRGVCGAVVVPLLWFYTAATEWQPSAVRSTVMMTVVVGGWALRRPGELANSLGAAALAILVWDPRQLFQASFQLSFSVVLSLALLLPRFEPFRRRLLRTDPLLPAEWRPLWQRGLLWAAHHASTACATSLAAWLGSLPLVAYYFHLFTPVSLAANLVVVPLSALALMSGMGSLVCGDWLPGLGVLFHHSGWFFMRCMSDASEWFARLPAAYLYVAAPGPVTLALYFGTLLAVLGGWFRGRFRWWTTGALGLLAFTWAGLAWQQHRTTTLTVLPLNGGHAVFVDAPGRSNDWLMDCGDASTVEFVTRPFLRAQGVGAVPRLVLTHGDVRHVGGATNLARDFQVSELHVGPARFLSQPYRQTLAAWTQSGRWVLTNQAGDRRGAWTVLHPGATDAFPHADDNALVLRGEIEGVRVLLCSDLGNEGQAAVLRRGRDVRADIVIAGLPRSGEPLGPALLDAVRPRVIIVADAEYPASERAGPRLRQRLTRHPAALFFMRESQAVTLRLRNGRWWVRDMSGTRAHGHAP